jgi:outer membrane receptor for Fe3+-dicitrate
MLGVGYLPITGGLLLGDEAATRLVSTDRFPVTQDQRNTVRSHIACQVSSRAWVALAASYGSGLPVEFAGDREQAIAQYGQRIVDRVDLARGRVLPFASLDASTGIVLVKTRKHAVRLQADVLNLTDRLNVIDFAGLLSGTALAPPRSAAIRLQAEF